MGLERRVVSEEKGVAGNMMVEGEVSKVGGSGDEMGCLPAPYL